MAENNNGRGAGGLFVAGNNAAFGHRQQRQALVNVKLMLRNRHPDVDEVFAKILARAKNLDGLDEVAGDKQKALEERHTAEQMISLRNQNALKAISLVMQYSIPKPAKNKKNKVERKKNPLAGMTAEELLRLANTDVEVVQ